MCLFSNKNCFIWYHTDSVKCLKKFQSETINEEIEQFIKYALIQAPFNIKKKETNKSM